MSFDWWTFILALFAFLTDFFGLASTATVM